MDNRNSNDYIDLLAICNRFFRFFKVFWPAILLLSIVLMCTFGAVALKPPTRTYSSHIVFTYGIKPGKSLEFNYTLTGHASGINIDIISTSMQSILDTKLFRNALKEKLDTDSLSTTMSMSFTPGTNLGILYSDSLDEDEVLDALDATLEILPDIMLPVSGPIELRTQGTPADVKESVDGLPLSLLAAGGFFVGVFLGMGALGLVAFTRQEISSESDVNNSLNLKTFGSLPFLNRKGSIPILWKLRNRGYLPRLFIKENPELIETPAYQENLRLISSQIIEDLKASEFRSMLIMSTRKAEGKTTFAKGLKKELSDAGWKVTLIDSYPDFRNRSDKLPEDELLLLDFPGATTADMETMEAAEYADASLLVIKSDTVLPKDAKWGLHFLENCHAECIGVVLNACI